jgi:hypothetical protein
MGAKLALLVMRNHADLSGNAFKVATKMAWTALDQPNEKGQPARLYFGGWKPLAIAQGWTLPDEEDKGPEAKRRRKKLQDYVSTAVGELITKGVIEASDARARVNVRQTYTLLLDLAAPQKVGSTSTPESGEQDSPGIREQVHPRNWGNHSPESGEPRNEQDQGQGLLQEPNTRPSLESHPVAGEPRHDGWAADDDSIEAVS